MIIDELDGDFLQRLRGFYYVAQTGSLTAAATKMHRSQPAISYQIKNLEKELGVQLFSTHANKKELTREGKLLYKKASDIFHMLHGLFDEVGSSDNALQGELSIVSSYVAMQCYLPDMLSNFSKLHPGVSFRVSGGRQLSLYEQVFSRAFDMAIMCVDNAPPDFTAETLFASNLVLISPRQGKYAVPALSSLEEINTNHMLGHPDKSSLWPLLRRQFVKYGLTLQARHTISHFDTLIRCVRLGMGIGIVDEIACSPELRKDLHVVSLSAYFPVRHFGVVRRYDAVRTEIEEQFITFLRTHTKEALPICCEMYLNEE